MKKAFSIFDTILTLLVAGFAVIMLIPMLFHIRPYVVWSGSMYPTYNAGAICYVNLQETEPERGDIVMYSLADELITHRVVGIDQDGNYITQGDNNNAVDLAPVTPKQIKGKVVFWIPVLGFILAWVHTSVGIFTCIAALIFYIVIKFIVSHHKDSWN